jgi:hypothetical protein
VVELDWDYYEFVNDEETPGEFAKFESEKEENIKLIYEGHFKGRLLRIKMAKVTLPDELLVGEEDSIKADTVADSAYKSKLFKDFSYYLIKLLFGLKRENWHRVRSFTATLNIENTSNPSLKVSMPDIFPKDTKFKVGQRVKGYSIGLNLSAKGPNTDSLVGFTMSTSADLKAQNLKKIEYDLTIPEVSSYTNGNNTAEWTFLEHEAIAELGQYRTDMLVGIPKNIAKTYRVNMLLSANVKFAADPKPILHSIPITFMT